MNVSDGQFGDSGLGDHWARPQEISNPFKTSGGWNADQGIQTGVPHPRYEHIEDPLPWKAGAANALDRRTAWRSPFNAPGSKTSLGSTMMGGASGTPEDIPQAQSPWRSTSFAGA